MNREKLLQKLKNEVKGSGIRKLAERIEINYVTLWRIIEKKSKNGGSAVTWDAILKYYK